MKSKLSILFFCIVFLAAVYGWAAETLTVCSYGGTYNKGL